MSEAKSGDTVNIHYIGTLPDGTEFDSSQGREPLEFTLGSGQVIAGFEQAVEGMSEGEKKTVSVAPEDAFGERRDSMEMDMPRSKLPEDLEPAVGMPLTAEGQDGQVLNLTITAVGDDSVRVDANHPLAGKQLKFDIELVKIA